MGKATREARKTYRQAKKSAKEYGKRTAGTEQGLGYQSYMKTGKSYGNEGSNLFQEGEASAKNMASRISAAKSQIGEAKITDLQNRKKEASMAGNVKKANRLQNRIASATGASLEQAKYGKTIKGGALRNPNRRKQT